MFCRASRRSLRRRLAFFFLVVLFGGILFALIGYFNRQLSFAARHYARLFSQQAVNEAVFDCVSDNRLTYRDLVKLERNENGHVTAVTTDTVMVNRLKATLERAITRTLEQKSDAESFSIPLGSLSGIGLFLGHGPCIRFHPEPCGAVTTKYTGRFTAAGINQTHHELLLTVQVDIAVYLPFSSVIEHSESELCLAESVLIGGVPEAYTQVSDGKIADDIVNYGAKAQ